MNSKHIVKYLTNSIIVILLLIAYGFYSIIHTEAVEDVEVKKVDCTTKEHVNVNDKKILCKEDYYLFVNGEKVVVEDKNTWSLIKEDKKYDLEYEWHAFHTPKVKTINIAGEGNKKH